MKFIRSIRRYPSKKSHSRTLVYMHGYGGFTWQARRQINVLQKAGYEVIALDFKYILRSHNPQDLPDLMDEVNEFFKTNNLIRPEMLIVGISLGGLVGYNMLRRHKQLNKLVVLTGGDISHLPSARSLTKRWKLTRQELIDKWANVNIYTTPGTLKNRHIVMTLPLRDKVIDPEEVIGEFILQQRYNDITMIRTKGGHFRTIISQTILQPKKLLSILRDLENY